mgnify:CR=1 FL=1
MGRINRVEIRIEPSYYAVRQGRDLYIIRVNMIVDGHAYTQVMELTSDDISSNLDRLMLLCKTEIEKAIKQEPPSSWLVPVKHYANS